MGTIWVQVDFSTGSGYNTGTRVLPDIYALAPECYTPSDIMHICISGETVLPHVFMPKYGTKTLFRVNGELWQFV